MERLFPIHHIIFEGRNKKSIPNSEGDHYDKVGCTAVGYQDVNVCIPVTIKPFGEAGNAKTQCMGKAVVTQGCDICPGKPGDVCKFTISQKLRVEVPVVFGARELSFWIVPF